MKIQENYFSEFGCLVTADNNQEILSVDIKLIKQLFKKNRAILFRGFKTDLKRFENFTDSLCTGFLKHRLPYLRPSFNEDETIVGVLTGNQRLALHSEMNYSPIRPDILFLNCYRPASRGGETTICCGFKFWQALAPKQKELFSKKRIKYIHYTELKLINSVYGLNSIEEAVLNFKKMGYHQAFFDTSSNLIVTHYFDFARKIDPQSQKELFINSILNQYDGGKTVKRVKVEFEDATPISEALASELDKIGEENAVSIKWQAGDLLMMDNNTLLHGRHSFSGERVISCRFGTQDLHK